MECVFPRPPSFILADIVHVIAVRCSIAFMITEIAQLAGDFHCAKVHSSYYSLNNLTDGICVM